MPKACKSLLDQVLCHINFDKVLGEEWLHSCDSVDSACEVVRDHFKETDTVVSKLTNINSNEVDAIHR